MQMSLRSVHLGYETLLLQSQVLLAGTVRVRETHLQHDTVSFGLGRHWHVTIRVF